MSGWQPIEKIPQAKPEEFKPAGHVLRSDPAWVEMAKARKNLPLFYRKHPTELQWAQCVFIGMMNTSQWGKKNCRCIHRAASGSHSQLCGYHKKEKTTVMTDTTGETSPKVIATSREPLKTSVEVWAEKNRTIKGSPFSLVDYPYLREIYACEAQRIVLMKACQVGATEMVLNILIHFLKYHPGTTGLYILPSQAEARIFSDMRIAGIFTKASGLTLKSSVNNKSLKQIGESFLLIRGCEVESHAQCIAADIAVWDELDYADQSIARQYRGRLKNSRYAREISIGYPRGTGIKKLFDQSDQRHYMITCPGCLQEFALCCSYFTAIKEEGDDILGRTYRFACPSCNVTWDRREMPGQWKPNKKSEIAGFHLSRMLNLGVTAEQLWKEQTDYNTKKEFFMLTLGLPWEDRNWQLKEDDFDLKLVNARYDLRVAASGTFAGVDQGDALHLYIDDETTDGKRVCVHAEIISGLDCWEQLAQRFRQFGVVGAVIDAQPNKIDAERFCKAQKGLAWWCFYQEETKTGKNVHWKEDIHGVNVDRFYSFDLCMESIVQGKIVLPRSDKLGTLKSHWKNVLREMVEDNEGGTRATWRRLGPDHFWHALVYCTIARLRRATSGGLVLKRWKDIESKSAEREVNALELLEQDLGEI